MTDTVLVSRMLKMLTTGNVRTVMEFSAILELSGYKSGNLG